MKKINSLACALAFLGLAACNSSGSGEQGSNDSITDTSKAMETVVGTVPTNNVPANPPLTGQVQGNIVQSDSSNAEGVAENQKNYTNDKGDKITAVYADSGDMGVANLKIKGEPFKLMRLEKKGSTTSYSDGKRTWTIKADGSATLEKDNVVSNYKEEK